MVFDDKKKVFHELANDTVTSDWLEGLFEFGESVRVGESQISDNHSMAISFFQSAKECSKLNCKLSLFLNNKYLIKQKGSFL